MLDLFFGYMCVKIFLLALANKGMVIIVHAVQEMVFLTQQDYC